MMTGQSEAHDTATRSDAALDETALGDPIVSFDRGFRKQVIFVACGAALVALGVCGALFFHDRGLGQLVQVGVIVLFLAYFFMGRLRVYICPGGVIVVRQGKGRTRDCCRWEEISEIVYVTEGLIKAGGRRCSLVKREGARIDVPDLGIAHFDAFVDTLRRLSAAQGIPWREEVVKRPRRESVFLIFISCLIGFAVFMLILTAVMLRLLP